MSVLQVTAENFRAEVLERDIPVVVDFYADWCGPCHQIAPVLRDLSERWDGEIAFVKVDIDGDPEIAQAYRVRSVPAVLRFEGAEVKAWSLGAKPGYVLERELGLSRSGVTSDASSRPTGGIVAALRRWWGSP